MNNKEEWIERTLEVDAYINSAIPSEDFINRLKSIPNSIKTSYSLISKRYIWATAASIALLICLNVFSAKNYLSQNETASALTETINSDFNFLNHI